MSAVVGLHGSFRHGKSFFAEYMLEEIERLGMTTRIASFAAPLKAIARELGWDGRKDEGGRRILQILGTDIGRNLIDKDIWVKKWVEQVEKDNSVFEADFIIADDMRFQNEVDAIKGLGGCTLRVVRINPDGTEYREPGKEHLYGHESESVLQTDHTVTCGSGELEMLSACARQFVRDIIKGTGGNDGQGS